MARPRKTRAGAEAQTQASNVAERLSPVTENYLLSLYKMWEDTEIPTLTRLTEALRQLPPTEGLGTSVPSVAGMLRRMEKQGLVEIGSDKRIRLTDRGTMQGESIARRHRLAEWLVVSLLGMELHEAHIEAHQLEHGMSPAVEAKLMERLGNPTHSPFGWPIPGNGSPGPTPGAVTLDNAASGSSYVVDRVHGRPPNSASWPSRLCRAYMTSGGIVLGRGGPRWTDPMATTWRTIVRASRRN